jgi:type II secretory pathway predicted ATPase ExeA
MDYLNYYELEREPFSVMPITRFYYHSEQHDQAMEKLQYAVSSMKGLAVLIGDVGTGKTTLARRLLDSLPEDEYEASLLVIIHSDVSSGWLLKRVALQLGIEEPDEDKVHLLSQLYERLIKINEEGKKAVVLIDEAQMLRKPELMEEIRGLLNLELPEEKLVTFVFFGMPELEACLSSDPPLAQRIAVRHRLRPLPEETSIDYIRHRLNLSGAEGDIFSEEAAKAAHKFSNGVPRLINVICDNALFEGYVRKLGLPLGTDVIDSVVQDLGLTPEK